MKTMIIKAFCIIVLLCLANPLFSQEAEAGHAGVNLNVIKTDSLKQVNKGVPLSGTQTRAGVSSYTDQTVSTTLTVYGNSMLTVQNVTVTNTGRLTLLAPGNITINGTFLVNAGGTLNVTYGQQPQRVINFGYDPSGNMTSQQSSQ